MAEKARVAVIGTGWWSTYTHIPGLIEHPNAELVALCDRNPEALAAAAERYGIDRTYSDVDELLANEALDGAVVAVYHAAHYAVARQCLEAGLHIMLEKPMVLTAHDGRALLDLAAAQDREIIVGYPWHFTDVTRTARDVLASGELGPIQHTSCLFASMVVEYYRSNPEAYRPVFQFPVTGPGNVYADAQRSGGGQAHLQITHSAGSLFYITGLRARSVTAFMNNYDVPVDLVDAMAVQYDGGAVGVFGSTGNLGVGDAGQLDIRVYCANGYLLLEQVQGTLTVRKHDGTEQRYGPLEGDESYPRFATAAHLVDVILGQASNRSPGEVGLRVVELLDAAYCSAGGGGQPVAVRDLYR